MENDPFKIRIIRDKGEYFDDEMFTHKETDTLYVKVGNHPIETAIKLLEEQGFTISIKVTR